MTLNASMDCDGWWIDDEAIRKVAEATEVIGRFFRRFVVGNANSTTCMATDFMRECLVGDLCHDEMAEQTSTPRFRWFFGRWVRRLMKVCNFSRSSRTEVDVEMFRSSYLLALRPSHALVSLVLALSSRDLLESIWQLAREMVFCGTIGGHRAAAMDVVCRFAVGFQRWKVQEKVYFNDIMVHTLLLHPSFQLTGDTLDGVLARNILPAGKHVGYLDRVRLEAARVQLVGAETPSYDGVQGFLAKIVEFVNVLGAPLGLVVKGPLRVTEVHSFSSVVARLVYGIACMHERLGAADHVTLTLDRWLVCTSMLESPNVCEGEGVYFILGEVYDMCRLLMVNQGNHVIDGFRANVASEGRHPAPTFSPESIIQGRIVRGSFR
jgi:hypothetical protein